MNQVRLAGEWQQIKGKVKEKRGKLTDDDLAYIDGKRGRLLGRLQERYGVAKEMVEKQLRDIERN